MNDTELAVRSIFVTLSSPVIVPSLEVIETRLQKRVGRECLHLPSCYKNITRGKSGKGKAGAFPRIP